MRTMKNGKIKLVFGPEPTRYDVLCGRGRDCYEHLGNKTFRKIINDSLVEYAEADTKHERGAIVSNIVESIRTRGGRGFLRFDNERKAWVELAEYEARQKVGQTIREVLTQRNPIKRAAYRNRQAVNKARRVRETSTEMEEDNHEVEVFQAVSDDLQQVSSIGPESWTISTTLSNQTETSWNVATVLIPDKYDILCGRGVEYYENPGNQLFRQVIDAALPRYIVAESKHSKSCIVTSLVDALRRASPNGFLRYDQDTTCWIKLDDYSARQKVGQTMREALTHQDPNKKAASRKRRAISKARRKLKTMDNQWRNMGQADSEVNEMSSSTDDGALDETDNGNEPIPESTAIDCHPLQSILIAISVQRQRE